MSHVCINYLYVSNLSNWSGAIWNDGMFNRFLRVHKLQLMLQCVEGHHGSGEQKQCSHCSGSCAVHRACGDDA